MAQHGGSDFVSLRL